ncbi:MAG: hypothetical protein EZS28_038491, partial [Streblomastix strix]
MKQRAMPTQGPAFLPVGHYLPLLQLKGPASVRGSGIQLVVSALKTNLGSIPKHNVFQIKNYKNYPSAMKVLVFSGIPKEICPCLAQGDDIRGGNICPVTRFCGYKDKLNTHCLCSYKFSEDGCTCTQDYNPDGCICDTNPAASYDPTACLATKLCTGGDFIDPTPAGCIPIDCQSSDQAFKCNCKPKNDPVGCTCPSNPLELIGISPQACVCRQIDDIRQGTTCPITRK